MQGSPRAQSWVHFYFCLYIYDISDKLISLSRLLLAIRPYQLVHRIINDLKETLNHDLEELVVWSKNWKVKFNPDKTELLCMGKIMEDFNLRFNDSVIQPVESQTSRGKFCFKRQVVSANR